MTAPDPTWTVAPDADGDLTLWRGDLAILRPTDLRITTSYQRPLFDLLTRVLAPDDATVDLVGAAIRAANHRTITTRAPTRAWPDIEDRIRDRYRGEARQVLAALAGTSAQARHTADDATGGGEHG